MTEHHHDAGGPNTAAHDPAALFKAYITIFVALCIFTALSFVFNTLANKGWINHMTSAALILMVAVIKAGCVAYIFMHLKQDWGKVYCIMIPVVIMCVMIVIVLLPDGVLGWPKE